MLINNLKTISNMIELKWGNNTKADKYMKFTAKFSTQIHWNRIKFAGYKKTDDNFKASVNHRKRKQLYVSSQHDYSKYKTNENANVCNLFSFHINKL